MVEVVDVVLCGGGIKGAFQAGFLYALLESGKYEIDNIYAVSVGALIAPLLANKRKDLIKDMFFNSFAHFSFGFSIFVTYFLHNCFCVC